VVHLRLARREGREGGGDAGFEALEALFVEREALVGDARERS
jgi:hypothetical protein